MEYGSWKAAGITIWATLNGDGIQRKFKDTLLPMNLLPGSYAGF